MPKEFSPEAKDIIDRLLSMDPMERGQAQDYFAHPFFSNLDFSTLAKVDMTGKIQVLLPKLLEVPSQTLHKKKDSWVDLAEERHMVVVHCGELKKLNEYGQN